MSVHWTNFYKHFRFKSMSRKLKQTSLVEIKALLIKFGEPQQNNLLKYSKIWPNLILRQKPIIRLSGFGECSSWLIDIKKRWF